MSCNLRSIDSSDTVRLMKKKIENLDMRHINYTKQDVTNRM